MIDDSESWCLRVSTGNREKGYLVFDDNMIAELRRFAFHLSVDTILSLPHLTLCWSCVVVSWSGQYLQALVEG